MKLKRLYTLPEVIDPIEFSEGLNLILGESNETSEKENSVGKSLSVEFINFALLKNKSQSRVLLIPEDIFSSATNICIDFELNGNDYTIQRSIQDSEQPTIIENGEITTFRKLEDATKFLTEKLFIDKSKKHPSFRTMLGPLIRDERSEFKSLIDCYDTKLRIPENYAPHLYLLGINVELYEEIKQHIKSIDEISKDIKRIKENVRLIRQKDIDDARSDLNELDNEVHSIEKSIDSLENISGYEIVKDEIIILEEKIDSYRRHQALLKSQVSKLQVVSQTVEISTEEISEFYEQLKTGLGSLISKNLNEVINFKAKIDDFQNKLINDRRESLSKKVVEINNVLLQLDKRYSECLAVLNQKGELKNLKQTYVAFTEKSEQLSQLRSFVDRFDQLEFDKQQKRSEKESSLLKLQSQIQEQKSVIDCFEKTILSIHEVIQGNRSASFQIKHTNKKSIIEMIMRIDSDGGHSVEREKVFIYDLSLLLNEFTKKMHPGFLIHDNLFEVDQDTLVKSLGFLLEKAVFGEGQYIFTLNSDRLDDELLKKLDPFISARFTKNSRFLKKLYQQKH